MATERMRQVVYRYPAGETGSGEFAVWHIGTDRFCAYSAEGIERWKVTLNGTTREYADTAASDYGQVVSATESPNLYPRD